MDIAFLRQHFAYDPETGAVTKLRQRRGDRLPLGTPLGFRNGNGYLRAGVDGRQVYVHQIAWALATGHWSDKIIDHRNGDKTDNRLANLRECTQAENTRNSTRRSHSGQPYKGVRRTRAGTWQARIRIDNKEVYLGTFGTPEQAHEAYAKGAQRYHGEFARVA